MISLCQTKSWKSHEPTDSILIFLSIQISSISHTKPVGKDLGRPHVYLTILTFHFDIPTSPPTTQLQDPAIIDLRSQTIPAATVWNMKKFKSEEQRSLYSIPRAPSPAIFTASSALSTQHEKSNAAPSSTSVVTGPLQYSPRDYRSLPHVDLRL